MGISVGNIFNCNVIELKKIHNTAGNITIVPYDMFRSFSIRRVYYLYDIPGGSERGGHAHKYLYQIIIAVSGSFDVVHYASWTISSPLHTSRPQNNPDFFKQWEFRNSFWAKPQTTASVPRGASLAAHISAPEWSRWFHVLGNRAKPKEKWAWLTRSNLIGTGEASLLNLCTLRNPKRISSKI